MIRLLTKDDVSISCVPEDEYTSVDDDLSFEKTGVDYSDTIKKIKKRLNLGQKWAWCTVKVTVAWNDYDASEYLGCCSYSNMKDFIDSGDYYEQMVEDALANLNKQVATAWEELKQLEY